jgi:site-specific recombinase XerD
MREADEPLAVLSRNQIDAAVRTVSNPTHHAMLHLGLNAGLRAEEIITFPSKYVVDCSKLSAKVKSVAVHLNPRDMDTKNDKPRIVRVSVPCMNRLWQYREAVRPALEKAAASKSPNLFLTRFGEPFAADGLVAPLGRLGERLGFHIHPHMLRHTFATHTLAALEDLKRAGRLRGSPIVILKGLLGHSSVTTTSRYLHFLDAIDDAYGTRYQSEIDSLVLGYLDQQK